MSAFGPHTSFLAGVDEQPAPVATSLGHAHAGGDEIEKSAAWNALHPFSIDGGGDPANTAFQRQLETRHTRTLEPRVQSNHRVTTQRSQRVRRSASTMGSTSGLHVDLSRHKFTACWLTILAIHSVCAAFYVMVAVVYQYLLGTALVWSIMLYSLSIELEMYAIATAVHAVLAVVHMVAALTMIWRSLRHCTLTFHNHPPEIPTAMRPKAVSYPLLRWLNRCGQQLRFMHAEQTERQHEYTELRINLRVTAEIAWQTYQCYRMSWYLSSLWLHRIYTAMLVMNCWTNPLMHLYIKRTNSSRKLIGARVIMDVVLDVMAMIVVPCVLLQSYYEQFDVVRRDFSREFYYDDQSLMRFLNEFKVLMVYSGIDLLQRLALGGDLFFCLEALKTIARPTTRAVVPTPVAAQDIGYGSTQSSWHPGLQAHDGPGLYAETKPSSQDCAFVVRPWFRTKPGCALIEISGIGLCAAQDTANAVSDRLAKFDDDAVAYLILSHHAALHVPRALQSLRYLVGLKMKNVTLVQWDDAAALTQTHHPQVRFVFLVQFNATALPPGLLSNDFPALLLDIEVCVSTLSTVPSSLPSLWPPGMWLFLDHSNFTTVPDVLLEMDLAFLNLAFNRIHDVPAKTFTNPSLTLIGVSGNPISVLPEVSPALLAPLGLLALDATNLTVLPSWMDETFLTSAEVYLGDTPYCNALGDDEAARTISDQPRCRLQDDCCRLHQVLSTG